MYLHAYGVFHMTWVAGIVGMAIVLPLLCRSSQVAHRYVRAALICLLVGGELQRYFTDHLHFPDALPFNLCNITAWVAVLACLRLSPVAVEFAYFAGLAGGGMAMITPDMGATWPSRFFVNHGAIIITAAALVFGGMAPLRPGALRRAYAWFVLYVAVIGLFDWRFDVNYAYLRHKPSTGTVLNFLGPWPFYIGWAFGVAFALFWLLWLPVRPRDSTEPCQERLPASAIRHAEHASVSAAVKNT